VSGRAVFLLACPVASGQQLQGAQKFSVDLTGRCPLSFVCPRSKKNLFFCPVTSAQKCQGGRARRNLFSFGLSGRLRAAVCSRKIIFFGATQLFLLPSGLICAELFDFFCGAWNLCSTLFQNPASEI
jgi:hypothetical protein